MMKKFLTVFLCALMALSLAACGQNAKQIDLAQVRDKIVADCAITDPIMLTNDHLLNLYGIDAADVKQSACCITMTGIFPDEVLMLEAVDSAAAARIAEKLNNRLTEVKNQSASYDPENYAIAQQCAVTTNGNYLALFISAKHPQMTEIYNGYLK